MNISEMHKWLNQFLYPNFSTRRIAKDYSNPINVNAQLCSECKGECCKRCGCHFSPDDFAEISFEFLKSELEKGYISIDYFSKETTYMNTGAYILRIRNQDSPIVDLEQKVRPCMLLTEKGCKLDYAHRPSGGKLLIPKVELIGNRKKRICYSTYSVTSCCHEWMPYQKLLHRLAKYFKDKDFPCSLQDAKIKVS